MNLLDSILLRDFQCEMFSISCTTASQLQAGKVLCCFIASCDDLRPGQLVYRPKKCKIKSDVIYKLMTSCWQ